MTGPTPSAEYRAALDAATQTYNDALNAAAATYSAALLTAWLRLTGLPIGPIPGQPSPPAVSCRETDACTCESCVTYTRDQA
jgi:hypothetical protein